MVLLQTCKRSELVVCFYFTIDAEENPSYSPDAECGIMEGWRSGAYFPQIDADLSADRADFDFNSP